MAHPNINFKLNVGTVSNVQSYVRILVHSDPNEKSHIAAACGCQPETGSLVLRITSTIPEEELNKMFKELTNHTYADLKASGEIQEFASGNSKWLKVSLDKFADGMISQTVIPVLTGHQNVGGHLEFAIESNTNGQELLSYREKSLSILYPFLKSFRITANTNLSKEQLKAVSELAGSFIGKDFKDFESFFGSYVNAEIEFDSYEDVPANLRKDLDNVKLFGNQKDLDELFKSPIRHLSEVTELHLFLTDNIAIKIAAHAPGINLLH